MSEFKVGDWVRLTAQCSEHPSHNVCKGTEPPPREFIGIYLGEQCVDWLSPELPKKHYHWNPSCLELFQRAPAGVSDDAV